MTSTKLIILYIYFLFSISLRAQSNLIEIKQFGTNPGNLNGFIHIPKNNFDSIKRKPLIVVLHGCTQNAETVARQSGWNKLADYYGFYVLYPQQKLLNNPNRCFCWYKQNDISKNEGEVLSIKQMIDFVVDTFSIDTTKIFAYGLSAGAAMSVALLADYPNLFNAGAILAGGPFMTVSNPLDGLASMISPKNYSSQELASTVIKQNPDYKGKYPRMIIIHGKNDPVVNIKNSYQLIQQWTYLQHTDSIPDKKTKSFEKNTDITKYIYNDSSNNEVVIFYEVNNLGHALMIDPGDAINKGGEVGLFAVDKKFFSTYWIAVDFGIIKK
jgi:poly(hydroxyalkanoate) depolymerase family esterase